MARRVAVGGLFVIGLWFSGCGGGHRSETRWSQGGGGRPEIEASSEPERLRRFLGLVLRRHLAAEVATEDLASVRTLKVNGEFTTPDRSVPFTVIKKSPLFVRTTVELPEGRFVQSYDGETAWMLRPGEKVSEARALGPEEAHAFVRDASIFSHLIQTRVQGRTVEFLEDPGAPGDVYKIVVKFPDGEEIVYHLDRQSYLPRAIIARSWIDGAWCTVETRLEDYRLVGGLLNVAFRSREIVDGEVHSGIVLDECMVNIDVLDSYFEPPRHMRKTILEKLGL